MLQCPFCLKPFKNYHSLQRHTNRLSKTAADEGQLQWKLPRVEDITILPDRRQETADEPESKKQGKANPRLRRNMWCMTCKDTESTELVRIVSKHSIVKAIKLLTDTTILHMPHSRSEVGQWLGMTSPSIVELDCYLPAMSCKAVLTGFASDLCTWAESEDAGLSVSRDSQTG
ncbi:hypothetical protein ABBQ32_012201 [Trebouxia sp. C0010 RCD-2024]